MGKFNFDGYAELLKNWVVFSQKHLYRCPEVEGLTCYGNGTGTNWGMQTHLKAMSAFAVAALTEEIDFSDTPITKEEVLSESLEMLRFALRTHLVGDFVCTDGEKWGHSWIFALGIERMFHAVELLDGYMNDEDKALLKKLMISESDFILNDYPIVAGLVENNKPESNIWNGAILYRTAVLYPDAPNKDRYMEKAYKFFANGISIESDENSDEIVGGNRIGDLFVGANMFDTFACNHHRYLNVGYMNICLSNIAMLHFFLKGRNIEPNEIIYHNLYEQWRLIRSTTFDDGRLLRIGGDTRARYCYCQDYALPTWQLIEDVFGEDLSELENEWLRTLELECGANGDGSFLSERFGYFEDASPLYYTRLESDRANSISLALYWHKRFGLDKDGAGVEKIKAWSDGYHGAAFVAGEERFASFAWRAAEGPQGLLVCPDESSLAEWRYNFSGRVCGVGAKNADDVESYTVKPFANGFLTYGSSISYCDEFGEGQQKENMARKNIAFAALPDGKGTLCLQRATALNRVFVAECEGVLWNIPNDIYNRKKRSLYFSGKANIFEGGVTGKREIFEVGKYLNADGKIGICSLTPLTLLRRGKRQIDIVGRRESGTLYCEEIASAYSDKHRWVSRGEILFDTGFAVSVQDAEETEKMAESLFSCEVDGIKSVGVRASAGKTYILALNLSESAITLSADKLGAKMLLDVAEGVACENISIESGTAALICLL